MQVSSGFLSDLSRQLAVVVVLGEKCRAPVHRRHPGLGQPALLKLLGADLPHWGGPARPCGPGARGEGSGIG